AAKLLFKARRRLGVFYPWKYLCEYEIGPVKPGVLQARGDVYLDGYWQSEKYFADAGGVIRREFALKEPPGPEVEALAARIRSVPAVSVHVRRGDLAAATKKFQVYGPPLKPEYYEHCLREMAARVPGAHFFVFSDDAEWPRANLRFPWPMTFVPPNPRDFDDFRLMAMCRHHIIANSSFSWWAAWLADGADKIVFAPRHYVHENTLDTRDLIPDGWIIA
ncbi:MAG TPA: alpha-1,2-fucosyltransferase, partial [Kiritimatiellia bacterium]